MRAPNRKLDRDLVNEAKRAEAMNEAVWVFEVSERGERGIDSQIRKPVSVKQGGLTRIIRGCYTHMLCTCFKNFLLGDLVQDQ